ncbi:MAG TPA: phosphoglycerate kinase [Candidatus Hodarchaeales archaeon]|nr:phosphoglycerate kinase [Candidatus Hodarchaeales archaeon]
MGFNKKTIEDIQVKAKRVLVRVDFNVPFDEKGKIADDLRIIASLPTINYLTSKGAKVILLSHLGRPEGKVVESMRMKPVYEHLKTLVKSKVKLANDCVGPEVEVLAKTLMPGEVLLLENTRFHSEEETNNPDFVAKLAKLGDLYVNDAFGTAHRAHASTEGLARVLPGVSGYLMQKEITYLCNAVDNPKHPFVAVLGGKKVSDKIPVLKNLLKKVDTMLLGGAMVYTFLHSQGYQIGSSILDKDGIITAKEIITLAKESGKTLIFPVDIQIASEFKNEAPRKVVEVADGIPQGWQGMDIGPKSIEKFSSVLRSASTILWNGPVGVFEMSNFAKGSLEIAKAIAENKQAIKIIGGGDTASAVKQFKLDGNMTHVSTGGGASLELLEGRALPGLVALQDK